MTQIVLASASARRKFLLAQIGLNAIIVPSRIKEKLSSDFSPPHQAILLALAKAEKVAGKFKSGLIIGADTIVVHKNKIFGKPRDIKDAERILSILNDSTHYVYTGIALIDAQTKKTLVDIDKTKVITKKIPRVLIKKLARLNLDKAGAYAVQENADILVKKIIGDYYNVVGLPLEKLKRLLKNFPAKTT